MFSFYEDRGEALRVGTHGGGLNRFKGGKFVTVTTWDGLYDNLAFAILEDDFGDLWVSGNKGVQDRFGFHHSRAPIPDETSRLCCRHNSNPD